MKHPIRWALCAGLLVLLAAFAPPLWRMLIGGPVAAVSLAEAGGSAQVLPWQVAVLPGGRSRVFGLSLGTDRLSDVEARFGDTLQLAIVASFHEAGALEALVDPMAAGFVSGRLVLAFDVPPDQLARWRDRSPGSTVMAGGVRRFALRAEDRVEARAMALSGLSFVPSLRLTEADVRERFGAPAEALITPDQTRVLRYPAIGMAASLPEGGRAVLQYVAPSAFGQRLGRSQNGAGLSICRAQGIGPTAGKCRLQACSSSRGAAACAAPGA